MNLPINRPSQMSYADELDFNGILGRLKSEGFNGFIRVTSGSSEGYILFREGKQRASSFENYAKVDAIEEIKSIVNDSKTFIELFDIKKSQMDYIIGINKFLSSILILKLMIFIDELKKTESPAGTYVKEPLLDYVKETENSIEEFIEPKNVDREELMKKYCLKDISEEEAGSILETYKGGSLSDDDVEKMELMLMTKIKKLIFGIPKIKGSEVMVSLDNTSKVSGTVNIALEYKSKGLLSRIMGESRDLENLKREIINITQIEVKKSFREYPEIVDDFVVIVWCKSF